MTRACVQCMTTTIAFANFAVSALGMSLLLNTAACAGEKAAVHIQAPTVTAALVTPAKPASPTVNVSDEIAAACAIRFNDVSRAPKFDFDRSDVGQEDSDVLGQVAKCLMSGPLAGRSIALIGRADPRGTSEYNMDLGAQRASNVSNFLVGLGLDRTKLSSTSRGELDATGSDEAGWQRDRRVDIVLR